MNYNRCTYHVIGEGSEDAEGDLVVGRLVHVDDGENGGREGTDDKLSSRENIN